MKFSFFIAKRYLFSKNKNNAVNIISAVSIIGVTIGAMALLVVLSAFAGLEKFSISMLSTFNPDIKVSPSEGKSFLLEADIETKILSIDEVSSISKTLEEKVFLRYKGKEFISKIKGVDSNFSKVNHLDSAIYAGRWMLSDKSNEVIVGGGISHYLSLGLNDSYNRLEVYVVKPGKGQISDPMSGFRRKDAQPVGLFAIEKEIDEKFMISNLSFAQSLLRYSDNQISNIEIKLKDSNKDKAIAEELKQVLGDSFIVETQKEQHAVIYRMMNTERVVTYLIFTLILIIAIFNVIGSISMLIVDKKEDIRTLWNLGSSELELKQIFTNVGILITIVGGFTGLFLGSTLVLLQYHYEFLKFGGGSLAYPVELTISNILISGLTILTIGYIASKLAVKRLSRNIYSR